VPEPDLEVAVLTRYVRPAKRDRLVEFVTSPKKRDRVFDELNTSGIFDPRWLTEFAAGRDAASLLREYTRRGMGGEVYLMCASHLFDGRRMPLADALAELVGRCVDVLAYCPASGTAFYEWHHSGSSWFLRRDV
jgi:hypothetical protein